MALKIFSQEMIIMGLIFAITVLGLFCCAQKTTSKDSSRVLHIHMSDGIDNETCLLPESELPCQSLGYIAGAVANATSISRMEIIINSQLELRDMIQFRNKSKVKLTSELSQITVNCSGSTAGLVFQSIKSLTIEYLTFSHCGVDQEYHNVERRVRFFRAAIHVISPTNVMVTNVTLTSSRGAGLAITDVQGGIVNISNSIFEHNVVPERDLFKYAGGGGIFIRMSRYTRKVNKFIFKNCLFLNNRQSTTGNYTFISAFGGLLPGTGRGGGLEIVLSYRSAFNRIIVSNCTFAGNSAFLGGALAVICQGFSRANDILIEDSLFSQNGCQEGLRSGSGGAMLLGYSFYHKSSPHVSSNNISVSDVTFSENCAEVGGGTTFFSSRSRESNFNNTISFTKCRWIKNIARVGAAIDISPHTADRLSGGLLPTPVFEDCEFVDNSVIFGTQDGNHAFGTGTFFSSLFDITFRSSVKFMNNSGSAFIIVNGVANFSSCNSTFINNTGVHGGAIALIGISVMYVGSDSHHAFMGNKASDRGGAIYSSLIDEHDFTTSRSCFIQHSPYASISKWNVTFTFEGNSAQKHGHSIFSTSLLPCKFGIVRTGQASFLSSFGNIFHFPNNETAQKDQIATDGARFELTENLSSQFIPGEQRLLDVRLVDDLNQSVETTVAASIVRSEDQLEVDDAFSCVSGNVIRLLGDEKESGNLLLQTVTARKSSILVNVTLAQCPPGFILNENECICDTDLYVGFTRCNNSHFHAHIKQGYWTGYVMHDKRDQYTLVTAVCPLGFCNYNGSRDMHLPQAASPSELDNFMCGTQRTGILCGKCRAGYTVYYNSPNYVCREAKNCKFGWLFYFLAEIVPVTILFVVVLTFNISFTSGSINGFILFSQLLNTLFIGGSGIIKVPQQISFISLGYRVIYGFFSLNLFNVETLSFCLWKGATVLDILAIKYVTIAYSLILIFSVIVFMRHCAPRMLGKYIKISVIKSSVIHGLSTFIVVCYVQCIKVSLNILLPQYLNTRGGGILKPRRVWLEGEVAQFSREHLPYAIPAILVLMTVGAIPPLVLIAYPLLNRVLAFCGVGESNLMLSISRRMPISKLKPFFDAFQGCFKDNLRFFAGLYFLYRWVGLLVYASTSSLVGFYTITEAVLIFILLIHAVAHPYQIWWHNTVDALLLANLAIINGITAFEYYYSGLANDEIKTLNIITVNASIQLVLIYLPILLYATAFILIVCYNKCYLPGLQKARENRENESHATSSGSRGCRTSECIPLEEFPARLLGDTDVEYEEFRDTSSDHSISAIYN